MSAGKGNRVIWVLGTAVTVLAGLCAFLTYRVIDQAITIDQQGESVRSREAQASELAEVLSGIAVGSSKEDFLSKLSPQLRAAVLEKGNDEIWIGEVRFEFENQRLSRIAVD